MCKSKCLTPRPFDGDLIGVVGTLCLSTARRSLTALDFLSHSSWAICRDIPERSNGLPKKRPVGSKNYG